jgi:hypothetical protein|tara:strand:- start:75211 stop:75363 length:153 start_codon:yes stop_codon:yes gene_type:complete
LNAGELFSKTGDRFDGAVKSLSRYKPTKAEDEGTLIQAEPKAMRSFFVGI